MNAWLLPLTTIVTAAVVVLVAYLLGIIIALARGRASLQRLAGHLIRTRDQTADLEQHLQTVNGGLPELRDQLLAVNEHLKAILALARKSGDRPGSGNRSDAGAA